jgi:hypothetical protein
MNQEILEEAKEIMREYKSSSKEPLIGFSEEAQRICNGAALNKIAAGERQADDNKQRTD